MEEKKHSNGFYVSGIVLIFVVIYVALAATQYFYPGQETYKMSVEVTGQSSAEILRELEATHSKQVFIFFGNNNLPFYFLGMGENLTRSVTVNGIYNYPVKVFPEVVGQMYPFVSFSEPYLKLNPGESKTLNVDVKIPEDQQPGNFTSKLILKARREV